MSEEESDGNEAGDEFDEEKSESEELAPEDDFTHQMSYSSYQMFVFVTCYIGYCIMLYNRKAFTFTLPHIILEDYYSGYEISMIVGAQTLAYTFSRFFCSWATDVFPPRLMMVAGLFLSGFLTLAFSDQEDWSNIMVLCAANGLFQGVAWPAVTKMMRAWYPKDENLSVNFGLWYAMLSSAANVIGAFGPSAANALANAYGWRLGMQIPAMVALVASPAAYFCLWDNPATAGYQVEYNGGKKGHWSDLAGNDFMLLLCAICYSLFVVKTSCQDWGYIYLTDERKMEAGAISSFMSSMEIGGLVGSIFLGAYTDFLTRRGYYSEVNTSPRMVTVQMCVAGSAMFLNLFMFVLDPHSAKGTVAFIGFMMGFSMYGAISLLGTIAIETAPIDMSGSALAAIGLASNFGAMSGGSPVEHLAQGTDWFYAFMVINCLCVLCFMMLILGKDVKAHFGKGKGGKRIKLA